MGAAFLQGLAQAKGLDDLDQINTLIEQHYDPTTPPADVIETFTAAVDELLPTEEGS